MLRGHVKTVGTVLVILGLGAPVGCGSNALPEQHAGSRGAGDGVIGFGGSGAGGAASSAGGSGAGGAAGSRLPAARRAVALAARRAVAPAATLSSIPVRPYTRSLPADTTRAR